MRLTVLSLIATLMISFTVGGCCSCGGKRQQDDDESTASAPVRPTK